ncbi:YceI family protein [Crocinitomix algicola]|uniref:YceI family protein n=1 Tax=Crocinitomix algicola TaxID=1740263 RepID=UPI000833C03B|nr:YceI family protein [Crocinitomix algicola]
MKRIIILGICAMPFFFASCGGAESEEGTTTDSTVVEEQIETVVTSYTIDTAATVVNWTTYGAEGIDHQGTIGALSGTAEISTTGEESQITGASLVIDMTSINEESEKLVGHLMAPDFFDVNTYATSEFSFDRHEAGVVYGSVSIIGKSLPVEAPVTVSEENGSLNVQVGEFKLDFSSLEMPFYVAEADKPEEEKHNPVIGFTATVVGTVAQ